MDVLSSICSLDPFVRLEGSITVISNPPKSQFQLGVPFSFEVVLADIWSLPECYEIYFDTLSMSRWHRSIGRVWVLERAPHQEGVVSLARVAESITISTMKRLGLFELAESVLDAQSSAFPLLRS